MGEAAGARLVAAVRPAGHDAVAAARVSASEAEVVTAAGDFEEGSWVAPMTVAGFPCASACEEEAERECIGGQEACSARSAGCRWLAAERRHIH